MSNGAIVAFTGANVVRGAIVAGAYVGSQNHLIFGKNIRENIRVKDLSPHPTP